MYIDTLGTTYPTESSQANSGNDLGKDVFLTLLVAQMENQDPLNPMEGTEFTAQLAQYSSLEQLYNVNDNLNSISDGQTGLSNLAALDFIGKEIYVDGNELTLAEGAATSGGISLESSAECTVNILDINGQMVKSLPLGNLDAGIHRFDWDGLDENGDTLTDGIYTFEVSAVGADGQKLNTKALMFGTVDRVTLEDGSPMLYVGNRSVAGSEVKDIRLPSEAGSDVEDIDLPIEIEELNLF